MLALKKQSTQIIQQAQKEKESFLKEKNNLQMMLQRVREAQTPGLRRIFSHLLCSMSLSCAFLQEKENLSNLEKKYGELTGGRNFPVNPLSMKEVRCDVICQSNLHAAK